MKKIYAFILSIIVSIANAQCPTPTITPLTRTLTCNGAPQTFTAIHTPSSNIGARWYNPGYSVTYTSTAGTNVLYANAPGIYTYEVFDFAFTCWSAQTVAVVSNTAIQNMTISASVGTVALTCNQPCIGFSITSTATIAPITYTWTNLTSSVSTFPANSGYTVCTPGSYRAQMSDGNACIISQTVSVPIFTFVGTPISPNNYTMCSTPTVVINANTTLSPISGYSYTWTGPAGSTISSPNSYSTAVDFAGTYTVAITGLFNGCTITHTAGVIACTGINNFNPDKDIRLFPNPNNGNFTLKIEKEIQGGELVLVNSIGQEVFRQRIVKGVNAIKLQHFPSGVYRYDVLNKNESLMKGKMVIE